MCPYPDQLDVHQDPENDGVSDRDGRQFGGRRRLHHRADHRVAGLYRAVRQLPELSELHDNRPHGATIRYTLDGSTPTETNGTIYNGAFTLTTSTTYNHRLCERPGRQPGGQCGLYHPAPAATPVFTRRPVLY